MRAQPYAPRYGSITQETDQLFNANELERVLRMFDIDAPMLPDRLLTLMPIELGDPDSRYIVTTDSWEVPVPPENLVQILYDALHGFNPGWTPTQLNQEIELMLGPELIKGLKMNVNRPFGNGVDDNGDGVVDDPAEILAGEMEPYPDSNGNIVQTPMDLSNNGFGTADNYYDIRWAYARALYCLAVIKLGNTDVNGDGVESTTPLLPDPPDAQKLAQWAINVVDFRDSDDIMTPFDYDEDLRDGWQPNKRVWGCEKPELQFSETLGLHDRRTEDLATVGGGQYNPAGPDFDFDSRLMPIDAAFIELYAPQVADDGTNAPDMTYPAELYAGNSVDLRESLQTTGRPCGVFWSFAMSVTSVWNDRRPTSIIRILRCTTHWIIGTAIRTRLRIRSMSALIRPTGWIIACCILRIHLRDTT